MTLIEIMVALTLMAMVFAGSLYLTGSIGNSRLQSEAMHLAGAIRFVHGRAAVNGTRYRLMLDLETNSFRAECTPDANPVSLSLEGQEAERRRRGIRYRNEDPEADPFGRGERVAFDDCSDPLLSERTLQGDVQIDRVLTVLTRDPQRDGSAEIGFYPDGFVDRTMIWLRRGTGVTTLIVDPMTGRVHITADDLDIPRDFYDVEEDR